MKMLRPVVYQKALRQLQTSSSVFQFSNKNKDVSETDHSKTEHSKTTRPSNITSSSNELATDLPSGTASDEFHFRFAKSSQQLSEEKENPDLKIVPTGVTAKFLNLTPMQKANKWMDIKLSPDLNQRRSEIWFGFWETWDTCMIAGRYFRKKKFGQAILISKQIMWGKPNVNSTNDTQYNLTYKEIMQIDRAKREFPKLLIAVGPFMVIPGSLVFWFPCLIVLATAFPSYLMPAHYMKGKSAKNYYGIIHRRRTQNYDTILKNFNLVRNNRFCPARVDTILTDLHKHSLPDPEEIINLYSWIQKENTMQTANLPTEVITAYARMLLGWMPILGIFQPRGLREYYLNKRLTKIFEMDEILRKDDNYKNLTRGQLREALFIRGVNGFEENLTRQANLFWLENWLKIGKSIQTGPEDLKYSRNYEIIYQKSGNKSRNKSGNKSEYKPENKTTEFAKVENTNKKNFLMTDNVASSYKLLSLFIWSANFRMDTYLNYMKEQNVESQRRANGEIMEVSTVNCPHCGYDCTDIVHQRVRQEMMIENAGSELEKRLIMSKRDKNILKERLAKLKQEMSYKGYSNRQVNELMK